MKTDEKPFHIITFPNLDFRFMIAPIEAARLAKKRADEKEV